MKIIDHGLWQPYVPDVWPADLPTGINILFCKRGDGTDWYKFARKLSEHTIKMTVHDGIVRAVNRDASMLFPQNSLLLEIIGDDVRDPQAKYGGKIFADGKFVEAPKPEPGPNPFKIIAELTARIAALEAKQR